MAPAKPPGDPWTRFALSVFRLNGLLMRAGEGISRPVGQSSARWQVIGRVFEPRTVADLARDMGRSRQGVQRIADALVAEGLVATRPHPTDGRTKLLELTPSGVAVLEAIFARQKQWSDDVMTKLDEAQLLAVADALETIGTTLEAELDAADVRTDPPTTPSRNQS